MRQPSFVFVGTVVWAMLGLAQVAAAQPVAAPTIHRVTVQPDTGVLTVTGTGLGPDLQVTVDGQPVPKLPGATDTQMEVLAPATVVTQPGTYRLTVVDPMRRVGDGFVVVSPHGRRRRGGQRDVRPHRSAGPAEASGTSRRRREGVAPRHAGRGETGIPPGCRRISLRVPRTLRWANLRLVDNTTGGANTASGVECAPRKHIGHASTRPAATRRSLPTPRAPTTRPAAIRRSTPTPRAIQHGQRLSGARFSTPRASTTRPAATRRSSPTPRATTTRPAGRRRSCPTPRATQHGQRRRAPCIPTPRAATTRPAAVRRSSPTPRAQQHGQRLSGALFQHHGQRQHGQRRGALNANTTGVSTRPRAATRSSPTPRAATTRPSAPMRSIQARATTMRPRSRCRLLGHHRLLQLFLGADVPRHRRRHEHHPHRPAV